MPDNKGKVLYVGGFELPDRNAAAHRVLNNAKILRSLGYEVLFCGVDSTITSFNNKYDDVCGFKSCPLPYPASIKQWMKQMCDISVYEMFIKQNPDIKFVFAYNMHALPLAKLLKFAKKNGIKVVADCTEWYSCDFTFNPIKLIRNIDTTLCMRVFQKKCDGMIAISTYLKNYYEKHIDNIMVLPPLVDLNDEKYISGCEQNDIVTLVYSGSPSASKEALGDVVKSLNKFKDLKFKLRVVGVTCERFIQIYNIMPDDEKVEFLGRVSHGDALNAVKMADYSVIIRPKSRVTMAGFPTKFAEAISCGTAVIANDTSDLATYIRDGKNGYIVGLDNLEIDLYNIISDSSLPMVENDIFDYKKWIPKFNEFIKKL